MIVWLASYPRSGNTLLRLMLKSVFDLDSFSKHDDAVDIGGNPQVAAAVGHRFLPAPWAQSHEQLRDDASLHLVKTHDGPEDAGKAIYVVRDGRSACRSFYHYLKDFPHVRASCSLLDVVVGFTPFGSWSEHLSQWQPRKRPDTLLLKYEDLLNEPESQLDLIGDFLGAEPKRKWEDEFDRLHQLNPLFFRQGKANDPDAALAGQEAAVFWHEHGGWMKRLGYPSPKEKPARPAGVLQHCVAVKGRAFFEVSERLHLAEVRLHELEPRLPAIQAEASSSRGEAERLEAELQAARTNAQSRIDQLNQQLQQLAADSARREQELAAKLATTERAALEARHARDIEQAADIAKHAHELAALSRETDARVAEIRAILAHQTGEWKSQSEKQQDQIAQRGVSIANLEAQLEQERARSSELNESLAEIRKRQAARDQQLLAIESDLLSQQNSNRDLKRDLIELRRSFEVTTAGYRRRIDELTGASWQAQKRFATTLQEHCATNETLAAAMHELNSRLRMLLTSRLLHLGWRIGLGSTPYWNDPAADELTDLLDQTRPKIGADSRQLLQRVGSILSQSNGGGDMESALSHLVQKGFNPKVVLDIGAAKGYWTLGTAYRWKQAEFYMIDPLAESEPDLQAICRDPRFHYLRLAIGDKSGEMLMHVAAEPDGSSLLLVGSSDPSTHQSVPVRTLDQLLDAGEIKPAQLIKIDVQGFELNVLRGATKLFEHAEVFIIEANFFEFMPGCPRLHELIAFMAQRGFYPFDFAGFLRRPHENDLGQIDVVFVHRDSPMVASNSWLTPSPATPGEGRGEGDLVRQLPFDSRNHFNPLPEYRERGPEPGTAVSVIVCTKDPVPEIFDRALDALDKQTLDKRRFELVVVDNASAEPLQESELNQGRSLPLRIVREPIPGLGRARVTGISASRGDVLVFVDDDNFLDPDYLQRALEIAQSEPRIGLFGGISTAELGGPMAGWKAEILPHLGIRNHGDQPITRFSDRWGEWEPIGAGMVARRAVAERFVKMFNEIPEARLLGRSGSALLSGEDSLFARAAFREGFACSYQPVLKLTHYLKASRLTFDYLSRVLEGHGRSYVILHRAMGKPVDPLPWRTRIARWIYRVRKHGRAGLILARWERGYAKEMTSPTQTPALRYSEEPGLAAKEPGPSAYLRTGVGNDTNRLEATSHPV